VLKTTYTVLFFHAASQRRRHNYQHFLKLYRTLLAMIAFPMLILLENYVYLEKPNRRVCNAKVNWKMKKHTLCKHYKLQLISYSNKNSISHFPANFCFLIYKSIGNILKNLFRGTIDIFIVEKLVYLMSHSHN
jgi:hypothetical protein